MSKILIPLSLWCVFTPFYLQAKNNEPFNQGSVDDAFHKGCLLYAQYKFTEAEEWLTYAADQGNQDAAYLNARLLAFQTQPKNFPEQSKKNLENVANQGHLESMRFLYEKGEWLTRQERLQWQQHYYNQLINLGAEKPAQAYFRLSQYHNSIEHKALSDYELQQAVKLELPNAYLAYAGQLPIEEAKAIYLTEAKKGVIPAIRHVITILEQEGKFDQALYWREINAELGDLPSVASLGLIYQGNSERYNFVPQDLAKAYAYYLNYLENAGTARFSRLYKKIDENLNTLSSVLSPELLTDANTLAQSWNSTQYYYYDALWEQANCSTK
ncbi:sel1 repeat family protein [Vibrio diazotrophicus]|uniref:sel1 repeat family protein n=1 Tax=Vibrio diazotrophicus TaxID=685 RepID=UPI00142D8DCF|nr:sel1 repeat family protein [Vibrio diazotrophicus]NIY93387.1 sel1 repeat family protein [Vibrio diazotrophicus]